MSVYSMAVFLHIIGALGIFAAIGLEWAGLSNLRRATDTAQVREWMRLLAATRWGPQGWILVALGGMVVIAALGAAVGGRRLAAIAKALPAEAGPVPTTLRQRVDDPALAVSLWVRTALLFGIVFLMSIRPSWGGSLAAMGVALLLGTAVARPALRHSRLPARVARSER